MRLVPSALVRPHHCAVYPQLGSAHPKGYFDTGNELAGFDNHIYVSVEAVETGARQLGWSPPEEQAVCQAQRDAALARIETLEQEVLTKQQQLDAIDVIESAAFTARKKRGPKPQLERTAA